MLLTAPAKSNLYPELVSLYIGCIQQKRSPVFIQGIGTELVMRLALQAGTYCFLCFQKPGAASTKEKAKKNQEGTHGDRIKNFKIIEYKAVLSIDTGKRPEVGGLLDKKDFQAAREKIG
jgi:hypothetical protein